jgi:hypothetical protein
MMPSFAGRDPDRGLPRPFTENLVGVDLKSVNELPITLLAGRLPRRSPRSWSRRAPSRVIWTASIRSRPLAVQGHIGEGGAPGV